MQHAATRIGLSEDLAKGIIDRFRSLPIARSAVLSGRILADSIRTAASVLVTAAVGMMLGFRLTDGPLAALGAFALAVGFLWMFPLTFASAAFARPPRCPAGCNQSSSQSDHRPHRGAARPHHRRAGVGPVLQSIAWIAGLTLVFAPLAIHRYRRLA
jgi:hypothetical protein